MIVALGLAAMAQAQTPAPPPALSAQAKADAAALMTGLTGQWNCTGAFANGRPLASDLSFSRAADGLSLRYVHVSRAPNRYRQESQWGLDKDTGRLVSLAFTTFDAEGNTNAAMYVAESWTRDKVVLVHQRLLSDPFAPNRFTYTLQGAVLKMVWEVGRGGQWRMGDYLDCTRAQVRGRRR
jgi:hypothetical protein